MCRLARAAGLCLTIVLGASGCRRGDAAIGSEIADLVLSRKPPAYLAGVRWNLVKRVYKDRNYHPLWVSVARVPGRTKHLIESLCHAEREGLRPADYRLVDLRQAFKRLRDSRKQPDPKAFAALDLELTARFLEYGADLLAGRLDSRAVHDGWYIRARRAIVDSTLKAALQEDDFDEMLAPLRPRQREYADLVDELAHHREILQRGGWTKVPGGGKLKRGDRGSRVVAIRQRLQASEDSPRGSDGSEVFDQQLAEAVARFQERHGIPVDSGVGPATLAALNLPLETRIQQIEINLERYRWLLSDFGDRYVLINIPDYHLYAYEGGKRAFDMRVVVGGEYGNATPVFADSMTYLVFRPRWYVPQRILVDEMAPRIKDDIYYLAQNNLEVVDAKRESVVLDPEKIDWDDLDTTDLQFRVRQKGGDRNSLGLVKFMFPNQFSVYLHDTPARELFDRPKRTLSHGCVRVEDPVRLADYALAGQAGWNEEKVRQAMQMADSGQTVKLEQPVPVYILYLTTFMRDGVLQFRDDPYGRDRRVIASLGKSGTNEGRICEELQKLVGD
jgi:murein L,D-transpeptidase YcbB/YkuD